jgi:hypothetical protein
MANTYELIQASTVGAGGAASVQFNSIPNTFTDLKLVYSGRENGGATIRSSKIRINGDSGTNYQSIIVDGNGSAANTVAAATNAIIWSVQNDTNSTANTFSNSELYFANYASSNQKTVSVDAVAETAATSAIQRLSFARWTNTAAITAIEVFGEASNWVQFSTFYLYGIKNS